MPLPDPEEQARRFAQVRFAHRTEVQEDYVELIADLLREQGEARSVDLAQRIGVSHATVAATVVRLQKAGLVDTRPYRGLFLTSAGKAMAADAKQRHDLVVRFLVELGLDPAVAEADAEGLEHHASEATLAVFRRFLEDKREG